MEFPEEIELPVPPALKHHLEDDCFWIVRRGKLLSLPAELSVTALLRAYYQHSLQHQPQDTNFCLLAEVLDGLRIYFDFTLSDHLLYSQERSQFKCLSEVHGFGRAITVTKIPQAHPTPHKLDSNHTFTHLTKPTPLKQPSDVYGVEHFLRLFVKLPLFLSRAHLPSSHVNIIPSHIKDLFEYLVSQDGIFSESHYEDTPTPRTNGLDLPPGSDPLSTEQ